MGLGEDRNDSELFLEFIVCQSVNLSQETSVSTAGFGLGLVNWNMSG